MSPNKSTGNSYTGAWRASNKKKATKNKMKKDMVYTQRAKKK